MALDITKIRPLLKDFDFTTLFREHLGWDNHHSKIQIEVADEVYPLSSVAQKCGFVVFTCPAIPPDRTIRMKIDRLVTKAAREHLIIYTDAKTGDQLWEWVRRETGKPIASRNLRLTKTQSGDLLVQKLDALVMSLEDEEGRTIVDVTGKTRAAFDVDKVTKKFYERFKAEHDKFQKFIKGIKQEADLKWYTSLMLNRLMFVYFIQKKGFLDGDRDYLRNRLAKMRDLHGKDRFYSFYRYFLLRLFHEGLGKRERNKELEKLLGKVPFLNGGFFEVHKLEDPDGNYPDIQIADSAFEKLFEFFEGYDWHLDERPNRADNEINPDVVGYVFEKYTNQKQMGAYYTKDDITEYIGKNTIIPFLFDSAKKKCEIAFKPDSALWRMLRDDPERYIYPAVGHGVIYDYHAGKRRIELPRELPAEIAAGIDDVSKRGGWNKAAPPEFGLPTETWREVVARRQRCDELLTKLRAGEVHEINDLITLNLDIWQFARDAIVNSEGPELLRAFYHTLAGRTPTKKTESYERGISVLDPTCGSGAFLFAALQILETLYRDCIERMRRFIEEPERKGRESKTDPYADFRELLAEIDTHPSEQYYVLKTIIVGNLFGVDIMEEAVEICKLRLFLKLVAQVETFDQIEPLPDMDFNIRPGNTLVGYATMDELRKSVMESVAAYLPGTPEIERQKKELEKIEQQAEGVESFYLKFQQLQLHGEATHIGSENIAKTKRDLSKARSRLAEQLDQYLAKEYEITRTKFRSQAELEKAFANWKQTHQPFHWLVEFFGIIRDGGFDAIIGNPPYVVYSTSKVDYSILDSQFTTLATKNLYAFVFERSVVLSHASTCLGLIVQLTALSSERLESLQDLLTTRASLTALSFPRRPESIFDGVEMPVCILLSNPMPLAVVFSSRVSRFYTLERPHALQVVSLSQHRIRRDKHRIAKLGTSFEVNIYNKLIRHTLTVSGLTSANSACTLYYQEACRYWVKACVGAPYFKRNGVQISPPHGRTLAFNSERSVAFTACLMNSSLFYWFYSAFSDCEHINDALLQGFPIPGKWEEVDWPQRYQTLAISLAANSVRKTISTRQGHTIEYDEMRALLSKTLIDEIDSALGGLYGLSLNEIEFITSYDVKYRMSGADDTDTVDG